MRAGALRFALAAALLVGRTASGAPVQERAPERAEWLLLEVRGPLDEVRIPTRTPTRVVGPLGAGERRLVRVPVLLAAGETLPGLAEIARANRGASLGLDGREEAGWDGWRAGLPATLRARSLPPLPAPPARPAAALLALLVAGSVAVLATRRRAAAALAVGAASAALLVTLPLAPRAATRVLVHEGDAAARRWVLVEAARDRLELDLERLPVLRVEGDAPARLELELAAGGHSRLCWVARGGVLSARRDDPHPPATTRARNDGPALARCWTRGADGAWSAHGAWERGAPLPPARAKPDGGPPGWLAAALPQGVGVLVGAVAARETHGAAEWVRLTSFR